MTGLGDAAVTVRVPAGHPFDGQRFVLWPDSGATTYTDGVLVFESPLRAALRETRETLERTVGATSAPEETP